MMDKNTFVKGTETEHNNEERSYKKSHLNLISYAIKQGHNIGVYYDGECDLEPTNKFTEIKAAAEACDTITLRITDKSGKVLGSAQLVHEFAQPPQEIVNDHTDNDFMNEWWKSYEREHPELF